MTDQHGWAAITVEFLGSTDSKTVGHVFEILRGLNVRIKVKGQHHQDMRVVSVLARQGDEGGFLFASIGADGEPTGDEEKFIGNEDIEAIGVY